MPRTFSPGDTPFDAMGGEELVRRLVARFYDRMEEGEPELARLHECDAEGRVSPGARERFALFLLEWLGGPAGYSPVHGHPRLRMRHAHLPIDAVLRDAWLRCMKGAMDDVGVAGDVREFLDARFAEVAEMLRNMGP
jgi:hemoglobin